MTNHPNRGWRNRWTFDAATLTARHRDGWVFQFKLAADGAPHEFDGVCVEQPSPMTPEHMANAARVANEAGLIYIEFRDALH